MTTEKCALTNFKIYLIHKKCWRGKNNCFSTFCHFNVWMNSLKGLFCISALTVEFSTKANNSQVAAATSLATIINRIISYTTVQAIQTFLYLFVQLENKQLYFIEINRDTEDWQGHFALLWKSREMVSCLKFV